MCSQDIRGLLTMQVLKLNLNQTLTCCLACEFVGIALLPCSSEYDCPDRSDICDQRTLPPQLTLHAREHLEQQSLCHSQTAPSQSHPRIPTRRLSWHHAHKHPEG